MKNLMVFLLLLAGFASYGQSIEGSWKVSSVNGKAVTGEETVMIYENGYFVFASKQTSDNHFLGTGGGLYSLEADGSYTERFDFNTYDAGKVGQTVACKIRFNGDNELSISFKDGDKTRTEVWQRISGIRDDLSGTWVITGRKRDGQISSMTPGLNGGRFQWIAFNSETKEFSGTGGGIYTAKDGKYTEHLEFFSRDDSRVGSDLSFDYAVKDKQWHHSGLSSKGDPIYEIWSNYRAAYLSSF